MIRSAVTISLVPEARGGPFVFWDDLEDGCTRAAAHGFDAVEIFPSSPDALDPEKLKAVLESHHLKLAAIGSGAGWVKHQLRLTDSNAAIRRKAISFISGIIDLAGPLGAPTIIGSMQGRLGDGVSREQAAIWLSEAFEELGERAAQHDSRILYEPLNRYETNLFLRVADAREFLAPLRAQNIFLLCDLFHMNIEEQNVSAALRFAGERLGHVHFADSNRLAPGLGHTDFAAISKTLREMDYRGYVSAEVFPLPDSDTAAKQAMKSFRQWFPNSSDPNPIHAP
ncbi:MAG: sugar phosphate isomerase/epimerase family protein [Verrucomicrobiota bacterium]